LKFQATHEILALPLPHMIVEVSRFGISFLQPIEP
jgi:hypothetical protein